MSADKMAFEFIRRGLWRGTCGAYIVTRKSNGVAIVYQARFGGAIIGKAGFIVDAYNLCRAHADRLRNAA